MTVRTAFIQELKDLSEDVTRMGRRVEAAIETSIQALRDQNMEQAKEIIANDREINDMERNIEAQCLSLILKQQPVAADLRNVSTALKVVTDMERIGDHAADIAELVLRKEASIGYTHIQEISRMADQAKDLVHEAIDAFIQGDAKKAKELMSWDDEIDSLFAKIKDDVVELLKDSKEAADVCIDSLMVAKYLERIADHAVNICEWAEFEQTGSLKNVRII